MNDVECVACLYARRDEPGECTVNIKLYIFTYQGIQVVLGRYEYPPIETERGRNADVVIFKDGAFPIGPHFHQAQIIGRPVQLQFIRGQGFYVLRSARDCKPKRAVRVVGTVDTEDDYKWAEDGSLVASPQDTIMIIIKSLTVIVRSDHPPRIRRMTAEQTDRLAIRRQFPLLACIHLLVLLVP